MTKTPLLYTIGYDRITKTRLLEIVSLLSIDMVVDVRSYSPDSPVSGVAQRRISSGRRMLELDLRPKYKFMGDLLGDLCVQQDGLQALMDFIADGKTIMLLCNEECPGDCHRHAAIAVPLLGKIDALHVYRNEIILASELDRSIRDNDYYSFTTM